MGNKLPPSAKAQKASGPNSLRQKEYDEAQSERNNALLTGRMTGAKSLERIPKLSLLRSISVFHKKTISLFVI